MSALFEPLTLRGVTTRNRIWLAPMCQYSCFDQDGVPTDWHLVHLGARATGGFGLVMSEATAVAPEGRISPEDTGLWNDQQAQAWRPIVDTIKAQGAVAAVQLAHAGRKASTFAPFAGESGSVPLEQRGWSTVSCTDQAFGDFDAPRRLSTEEVEDLPRQFAEAARRAESAGFEAVEIHAAHGYLLHQFLSPLVNDRDDRYGGSFENRARIVLEVVDAVRAVWSGPLFIRFSATDWVEDAPSWDVEQTSRLAGLVVERGVDLVDISSGGAVPEQRITVGPGYQVPFAGAVRRATGAPVSAVGLLTDPAQAERVLSDGDADVVMLARAALREPSWPLRAAHELGLPADKAPYPPQYARGAWR
ncbi:NADH:flavin oxidoreductase/NADH oxidase [Aeromicrobium sp. CTD01-1L150]|uniref:NADH:flavin oxidoreductase/NADH oxidase n=1 Tax=Aeromicrobium sp. CTD01-1L150 TaxID=3341830 RepID=UPI0035C0493F